MHLLQWVEEGGVTDNDFATLINCNPEKIKELRRDFDEKALAAHGHFFFVDCIFIYNAEVGRQEKGIPDYCEAPFFLAMHEHRLTQN